MHPCIATLAEYASCCNGLMVFVHVADRQQQAATIASLQQQLAAAQALADSLQQQLAAAKAQLAAVHATAKQPGPAAVTQPPQQQQQEHSRGACTACTDQSHCNDQGATVDVPVKPSL